MVGLCVLITRVVGVGIGVHDAKIKPFFDHFNPKKIDQYLSLEFNFHFLAQVSTHGTKKV
jgi:hypothetical protein